MAWLFWLLVWLDEAPDLSDLPFLNGEVQKVNGVLEMRPSFSKMGGGERRNWMSHRPVIILLNIMRME